MKSLEPDGSGAPSGRPFKQMTIGSLFSGIGGFDLGLERAGYEIKWQVENDAWCEKVLAKHWPHVHRYGDIKAIDWSTVEPVDLICGGFPCQPFSLAGKRRGQDDDRYLWPEVVRCLDALRPTWFIGENVPGIINLALDQVLSDLEGLGYQTATFAIPACAVDAPHIRQRLWIVAHSECDGRRPRRTECQGQQGRLASVGAGSRHRDVADLSSEGLEGSSRQELQRKSVRLTASRQDVADAIQPQRDQWSDWTCWWEWEPEEALRHARRGGREEDWMSIPESLLGRVAHGVPHRVDRLRGLGNAVVPQIPEIIGRMIMEINNANVKGWKDWVDGLNRKSLYFIHEIVEVADENQ